MGSHNEPLQQKRARPLRALLDSCCYSMLLLGASGLIVLLGAVFGQHYLLLGTHPNAGETGLIGAFAAWDGKHYVRIAQEGYSYNPNRMSNVAFVPLHPLFGWLIATVTGWRMELSMLVASYLFLIAAFIVAKSYLDGRFPNYSGELSLHSENGRRAERNGYANGTTPYILLAFALFPTTCYFRMAYTESLFVFEVILTLYGMKARWPLWALAAIIGASTATRASGVALLVPLSWHIWDRSTTWRSFLAKSVLTLPAACWGLGAYMVFLYLTFGDPLAFAQTQKHWDQRPAISLTEKLWLELTLDPLACEYDPSCDCYQLHSGRDPSPVFSMYYANPIYFMLFVTLVAYGAVEGWLSREEVLAGAALLLFSYLSKGYATCMCSQARYASTVYPVYIVMGKILQRLPLPIMAGIVGVCSFFLGIYSALFVRWYGLY